MMRNASFHCRRDAQCLVNPAEVVMHVVERDRILMVGEFLAVTIVKLDQYRDAWPMPENHDDGRGCLARPV